MSWYLSTRRFDRREHGEGDGARGGVAFFDGDVGADFAGLAQVIYPCIEVPDDLVRDAFSALRTQMKIDLSVYSSVSAQAQVGMDG